jgi:serine O-acetyltransferase
MPPKETPCSITPQIDDNREMALAPVVEALCAVTEGLARANTMGRCRRVLPSRDRLIEMVEDLRAVLFPGYFGISDLGQESMRFYVGATLDRVFGALQEQITRGLCFACGEDPHFCPDVVRRAVALTREFIGRLPAVRHLLATDVQAAFKGDPAAKSADEAIFCYPGVLAITNYRVAHELHGLGVPLIPRIITEHAHSITGIDIHPGARIGQEFFIDHGTGVVIGETCIIGNRVRIYQGVTLGAKSFPVDEHGRLVKGIDRHPIVEDDVIIYSGATILGRATIGRGSTIGGNVWLTHSVPPGSRIAQAEVRESAFEGGAGI